MNQNYPLTGKVSRRKFLGSAGATAALSMVSVHDTFGMLKPVGADKPNSNIGGVQLGTITYSYRSMPGGAPNILKYCVDSGISNIELMSNDVEEYLGAPKNPRMGMMSQPSQMTTEQQADMKKYTEDMKAWRLALPMSKYEEVRKMFNDAGVNIHIIKFSPSRWSDEEIDYAFKAAKALGAKGVTEEIGEEACKKLAPFAEKHGLYAIFHQHMQFATPGFSYDPFIAISPAIRFNFDAGHFFGSTGLHPNTIIEKYHDRIINLHIKDKTGPKTDPPNQNQVWGQGEVPLADVLLLIKKQQWPIYCDIELEYDIKPWSNAVKEVRTCVNYAKGLLLL